MNLEPYLPVILFILIGAAVGVAPQVLGFLLGPNRPDKAKNSPYECGFEAFEDARMKFEDRKSTRLNSSHIQKSRMPSSA